MKKFWNNLVGSFRMERVRQLPCGVLSILIIIAIISIGWSICQTRDWAGAALNFGTDMAGAVVIYLLLEFVLGTRQRKEQLIAQMGSSVRDVAVPAADELRRQGWLFDGSLKDAKLGSANLHGANLMEANLQETSLMFSNLENTEMHKANLREADLRFANLRSADMEVVDLEGADLKDAFLEGAVLFDANLRGANLKDANYSTETIWPAGFDPVAAGAVLVEDDSKEKSSD